MEANAVLIPSNLRPVRWKVPDNPENLKHIKIESRCDSGCCKEIYLFAYIGKDSSEKLVFIEHCLLN